MASLLVLAAGELSRDPRARRAALFAADLGYDVTGVCGSAPDDARSELSRVRVVRVGTERVSVALRRAGLGGMKPSRPLVRELRGVFRLLRLLRLTVALARAAGRAGRFDVVHANDLDTLIAGWLVARRRRTRLVYDSHELYTSQEIDPPRLHRAVVGAIEGALARRAAAVLTSSELYARELDRRLRLRRPAEVLLNCPDRSEVEPPARPAVGPLRVIYQSAMGAGRPLGDILDAAEQASSAEITIRVVGADYPALAREIAERGLDGRVTLSDPVPPGKLLDGLRGYDAGLIINRPLTLTDELVVPNKLFEYMMAGLAVIAPHLPAIAPIVEETRAGVTFTPAEPSSLAAVLEELAGDRSGVAEMAARGRAAALDHYNAGVQLDVLRRVWSV